MALEKNQNNSTAVEYNNIANSDSAALLPHLESFEKMLKLPVLGAAWHQGQDVYGRVKGYNPIFNWAFRTAEDAVHLAVNTAAPIISTLDRPIQFVDQTLCSGIDKLEAKAPIIKEQPQEIYQQARNKVVDAVQPTLNRVCSMRAAGQQKAHSLKDLSWQKANEVLATQYGSMAVSGLDTTSALAERLLDYYFPKNENDAAEDDNTPIDANADPVLHTCQTVGRLSNKVARRVYRTVSRQVKMLKKEDVQEYVASLIAVLRLTQYLNFINERVQAGQSTIAIDSENERNEQLNKQQPPQQQQQPQPNGFSQPQNNEQ
ncbi:lipid storage droplets surface-binding protein 2 [Sitodiplosis mosellana]|uniref:lipid storage droplets surface-binding protein 2 n=1 Tax=Sitodiplosis mosellana TaxID=263140 RepID=UPI002444CC31|nr:lipid storage droplets surface-binding protein 2 [Sitodiplosis mosellana]